MESDIMDKITDFLEDHSIITYKWLSKEIGVEFQRAKLLLQKYLDQHGREEEIHATFCIIGREKTEKCIIQKTVVVRDCDVDKIKSRMHSISSQHVYSVQKVQLKNSTALYTVDLDINKHNYKIEPTDDRISNSVPVVKECPVKAHSSVNSAPTEAKKRTSTEIKDTKPMKKDEPKSKQTTKNESKGKQNSRNGKAEKSSFFANNKVKKAPTKKEPVAERNPTSAVNKNGSKTYQRIKRPRIESSSSEGGSEPDEDTENRDFFKLENEDTKNLSPEERESSPEQKEAFVTKQETANETFVDEDGYLVTKKTVKRITEPVKQPNIKNQTKPKPKPAQKKPVATKKNTQQSTLTSFFKKN